jgi:hypothetical protein
VSTRVAHGPVSPKVVAAVGRTLPQPSAPSGVRRSLPGYRTKNVMLRTGDENAGPDRPWRCTSSRANNAHGHRVDIWHTRYMSRAVRAKTADLPVRRFSLGLTLTEALLGRHPAGRLQPVGFFRDGSAVRAASNRAKWADGRARPDDGLRRTARRPSPQALMESFAHLYAQLDLYRRRHVLPQHTISLQACRSVS